MDRKLWKTDDGKQIIVESDNEIPLKDKEGKEIGKQMTKVRQEWDTDAFNEMKEQIEAQKKDTEEKIEVMKKELKALPRFNERQLQNLVKFKENFERVQSLHKKEQTEVNLKAHTEGLERINKDLEELNSVN